MLETGISYCIALRGDKDLMKYGPNQYDVPSYHRSGGGFVLGLDRNVRISAESLQTGKVLELVPTKKRQQLEGRAMLAYPNATRLIVGSQQQPTDATQTDEEILLDDDDEMEEDTNWITSGVDYRNIHTQQKGAQQQDVDQSEGHDELDEEIRKKTVDFNQYLAQNPTDIDSWLAFVDFQDQASSKLNIGGPNRSKTTKASLTEVKLSIFEKAFKHNPDDERLWLSYLRCGAEVWGSVEVLTHWDKALATCTSTVSLWAEYINLRQTDFASYNFEDCCRVFEDCLVSLHRLSRPLQLMSHREEDDNHELTRVESVMVYILLRYCIFVKQSGYKEKAFSMIQAIFEFNFYQPMLFQYQPSITITQMVSEFAKFWDSEVPRFGEEGAQGWQDYHARVENQQQVSPMQPKRQIIFKGKLQVDEIQEWLDQEKYQESLHLMARRMDDEEDIAIDEDPYRAVLSDDVVRSLFNVTTEAAKSSLVYSLFVFLGLPFAPYGVSTNTHFCTDTFTHSDLELNDFWPTKEKTAKLLTYVDKVPMENVQENDRNPFGLPLSYPADVEELFARKSKWFSCFPSPKIVNDQEQKFTRNAFQNLTTLHKNNDHLLICYLAFEASYGFKRGRALAKSLLKDQSDNLILWNAYALMENGYDHPKEARKVCKLAIATGLQLPETSAYRRYLPVLYSTFARMELEHGRPNEALKILISMGSTDIYDESGPSPTPLQIVQARSRMTSYRDSLQDLFLGTYEANVVVHSIVCEALLTYLLDGLAKATSVFEDTIAYIQQHQGERSYIGEKMWMCQAELVYRHATGKSEGYQPSQLRTIASQALDLFPNNTLLLGLFIWNEARTWIHRRVHDTLTTNLTKNPNLILHLVNIQVQLHRQPYDHQLIKTLFEEAVEDPRTRSSILLWRLYIQNEIRQGHFGAAKQVTYRALRCCPWSKELYMLAIQYLSQEMSNDELIELTNLMMEKDIRTHIFIEQGHLFKTDEKEDSDEMSVSSAD
ncbi:DUF1740-domain-containing protein [Hesseltinella vesiculosa]|uniref:DUF1740-domain-containing protein n=1 Tax=Hesseltinella vesiculosa TaxID=101127 RepID=A0A1X2GIV8_9FUNG|nr:DUF1740-domain-containing protein [Hesseltinella vesiculosa]